MTDPTTPTPAPGGPDYERDAGDDGDGDGDGVRLGHPVRNFGLVLAALAVLAVACWWTGLAVPRVEVSAPDMPKPTSPRFNVQLDVSNATPFAITVKDVRISQFGVRFGQYLVSGRQGAAASAPFRLGPSQHRMVTIAARVTRCDRVQHGGSADVAITARTPLGLTRTVHPASFSLMGVEITTLLAPCPR